MTVVPPVDRSSTVTSATRPVLEPNPWMEGTVTTMLFAVQLDTAAATPLTKTALPVRKPIPVIAMVPPAALTVLGDSESAYRTRA